MPNGCRSCTGTDCCAAARAPAGIRGVPHPAHAEGTDADERTVASRRSGHHRRHRLKIIRAIVAGERNTDVLAEHRDVRCKASTETIREALAGHYQPEHVFELTQALALYDFFQNRVAQCDERIELALKHLQTG